YNATILNGFPVPSEDPEYKNIALEFFSTEMIQTIGINKVFESSNAGDVGGALINITSKDLFGDQTFGVEASSGLNTGVIGVNFLSQSGSDFLGFANSALPTTNKFDFQNSLNPSVVNLPVNQSYTISGGKRIRLGENRNPLSFFIVATYETDYAYTRESIRNATSNGTVYIDQTGEKYSQSISQIVLTNVNYNINDNHHIAYNFMLLHSNDQYVGEYKGMNGETYQDADESGYIGFLMRQQTNDNLLLTHQLVSDWTLSDTWKLNAGISYNTIKGLEPDRRENNLSKQGDLYNFTGSNRQKRFFSELNENDLNIKTSIKYRLDDSYNSGNSNLIFGYDGRFVSDRFEAIEYNFSAYPGYFLIENLNLDNNYNQTNYSSGQFSMTKGDPNKYDVTKYLNAGYAEGNLQVASTLTANLGLRADYVDMTINHSIQSASPGSESINKLYFLPSTNLKYDLNDKNTLRLGISKTYTLPQSKEISPYQYVNIGFVSQGNTKLKPSENYNVDLKWDNYLSPSEMISINGFYKYVVKPIGRVDEGNSAGLLTYKNISPSALVAGLEFETHKNIFNHVNEHASTTNRLALGLNASYIYTDLVIDIMNTEARHSNMEGAAPFITNIDLSYNRINEDKNLLASLIFSYFSDRIYTIGAMGYKDFMEKGAPTLNVVSSYKWNKYFTVKFKATNLLNPTYQLTRISSNGQAIILNEYKNGMNISLGLSCSL
ncbi:MAG: TonB-dependent receptor, partial [Bacteroidales bacterium]